MAKVYTPSQVARRLGVSTTTLRRYEEQGLLPDVPRGGGNRRCYASVHLQAFITIRWLLKGYEIPLAYDVMRKIKGGETTDALWLVNGQLHIAQEEKRRVEDIIRMVRHTAFDRYRNVKLTDGMSIGQVAELAGVNASAIRHWEKEGLIVSARDPGNGYRIFTIAELRKILVISSLRKTIYYIENLKDVLNEIEGHRYSTVDQSFQYALQRLNGKLEAQFHAIAELMKYIGLVRSNDA
ncbi:MerR family DNA-binding transcriptional regulator [Paenibacillus agaridevorans]|uniref:MerR family DNA-binding transcriptional regulator n=1 Tax=Paenibacillus agaridevorans TaxID=171404 RepID=UPI001BE4752D|nr:MerR family DNA-binding transcriptional regulator [Paenibacillus agaridevorans]